MLDALISFNIRGVRFGVVVNEERKLVGLMSIKRIISFIAGHGELGRAVREEHNFNAYRAMLATPVSKIMRREFPYAIFGKHGLEDIINMMIEHNIGAVPVVAEDKTILGIVTERHLTAIVQVAPMHVAVHEVMSPNPVSVPSGSNLWDAVRVMAEKWIRHLPIVDREGRVEALLTARDIIVYLSEDIILEKLERHRIDEVLSKIPVEEVITESVVTTSPEEDLNKALRKLRARGLSSLVVTDEDQKLIGIVTERDIVTRLPKKLGLEPFYDYIKPVIVYARPFF